MVKMEKHKCKLCSRSFSSGRALGGHMRSHLANLPLPPKTPQKDEQRPAPVIVSGRGGGSGDITESTTSAAECCSEEEVGKETSTFSVTNDEGQKGAPGFRGLRKNPKKTFRSSAEDAGGGGGGGLVVEVVQDGESETESTRKNPTSRRRSKRTRRIAEPVSKPPTPLPAEQQQPSSTESMVSSVSNNNGTNSSEEDLAMCLIMLSRDVWSNLAHKICKKKNNKMKKMKMKIHCWEEDINGDDDDEEVPRNVVVCSMDKKVHECPFCGKVFGSGQALGGHKRSHFLGSTTTTTTTVTAASASNSESTPSPNKLFLIDLNLPAPMEEDQEDDHHGDERNEEFLC